MGANQTSKTRIGTIYHDKCLTERLGNSNATCIGFDDWNFLQNKFNYRLSQVNIWHDKKYITGLQSIYEMDGGKISPGSHIANPSDKKSTLILSNDEYIVRAYIRSGDWIDAIRLETNKGNFIEVGGNGGGLTLFDVPQGSQFIAFSGETDEQKYLRTLELKFDKIW